ncbi:acyl-CoA dehydrogenase [Nocardioides sp. GY 10113]|uniref:acyl-CoA dehydrogenase family protein n=1 Tax=Nocardioides sp. GY 10113 TaxID=2569761 RepID=UPI0010A88F64|nr:acyl-CoA dehydrogenase family protein [Nocardioides sp. GY 10113]TIC83273.1 acyl-CoA dehydrogenase [Nocardioides sp. GY 10113]
MSELDLLPSAEDDDLRDAVAGLLARRCEVDAVRAMYDGDRGVVAPLWKSVAAELGLAGLLVPEADGGAGATAREAAVVITELGRSVAPVPFLTSAVLATGVLSAAVDAGTATDAAGFLLADLAAGDRTAALLVPLSAGPGATRSGAFAAAEVDGPPCAVRSVAGALEADVLLVPVATPEGLEVRAVAATDAQVEPVVSLDMTRPLADVTVAPTEGAPVLVQAGGGKAAIERGLLVGAGLLASEQAGVAAWCLATTVAYLKERRQFGRVVGGFQALKHRLADLYVSVESASAVAAYAAAALAAHDPDAEVAVHLAAAYCSDTAVTAAEEAVQLHGGIGMTWEHPAHLYLKRAKADQIALGSPGAHRARLAQLVDLPAPG